jgi:sarcosine oxidase subunit gamma
MAESSALASKSAFAGLLAPVGPTPAGVFVVERLGLGLAAVEPRKGRSSELIARIEALHLLSPPRDPRRVVAGEVSFLGVGPDRWLAVSEGGAGFVDELAAALDGIASVIALTDGVVVLRISGPRARDTFAKGLPIDLDPGVFLVGDVASSVLAHIAVTIWRSDDLSYEVSIPRSFASDFRHWLAESAAEFGIGVGESEAGCHGPAIS